LTTTKSSPLDALADRSFGIEASGVSTPVPRLPGQRSAPPLTSDPDAIFAGRPNETFGRPLDVTFAGAPAPLQVDQKPTTPQPSARRQSAPVAHTTGHRSWSTVWRRYHIIRELGGRHGRQYQAGTRNWPSRSR
jgi:hypothetical protein